jgi:prepilin peptidase CpaA
MNGDLLPILIVIVPLTASAALTDLRTGLIPNRLVLLGLIAGCLARAAAFAAQRGEAPPPAGALLSSVVGVCICGAAPYVLFRLGAMGGGDVKLLGAVGAGVGPALGIRIELFAFILAALYVLARLAWQGRLLALLSSTVALVVRPVSDGAPARTDAAFTELRFAPAIFVATLLVAAEHWGVQ